MPSIISSFFFILFLGAVALHGYFINLFYLAMSHPPTFLPGKQKQGNVREEKHMVLTLVRSQWANITILTCFSKFLKSTVDRKGQIGG